MAHLDLNLDLMEIKLALLLPVASHLIWDPTRLWFFWLFYFLNCYISPLLAAAFGIIYERA